MHCLWIFTKNTKTGAWETHMRFTSERRRDILFKAYIWLPSRDTIELDRLLRRLLYDYKVKNGSPLWYQINVDPNAFCAWFCNKLRTGLSSVIFFRLLIFPSFSRFPNSLAKKKENVNIVAEGQTFFMTSFQRCKGLSWVLTLAFMRFLKLFSFFNFLYP